MASSMVPLGGDWSVTGVVAEGTTIAPGAAPSATYFGVTPHALRTLNIPLLAGRDFTEAEGRGRSGVTVINQALAKHLWPGRGDVIGRRFRLLTDDKQRSGSRHRVDRRRRYGRARSVAHVFVVLYVLAEYRITIGWVADAPPRSPARRGRRSTSDPTMPITRSSREEQLTLRHWDDRLLAWMFSIFGAVALFLASIGIYGVMSYAVSQRTQEIGVRMALGASRRHVLSLVLGHAGRIAAAGIALGVIGALGVTRIVSSLLYNVSATDLMSFWRPPHLLLAALVASYLPARRATVDPWLHCEANNLRQQVSALSTELLAPTLSTSCYSIGGFPKRRLRG
jgi:hypothetical protein